MTDNERDLFDQKINNIDSLANEKLKGVHAMIQANYDVQHEVNSNILATLKRIEAQTVKTNGRVTNLEMWRWKIIGISIGISAIVGILIKFVV